MSTPTFLLPIWNNTQFFDNNGNVLANGNVYQYEGGSFTVEQTTYQGTDNSTTPNPNPIVLDANGRMTSQMYGSEGLYYNLKLTDINGNQIETATYIIGSEASSVPVNGVGISVWNESATPTYVSSTEFIVPGSVTADYAIGNRVQFINGTTPGFGTVKTVTYTSPNTYVTIVPDSTVVGSNLTAVYWSSLVAVNSTVDAAGVSYVASLNYANTATVGGQIYALDNSVAGVLTQRITTPGVYNLANVDVNEYGFITAIQSGTILTTKGDLWGFSSTQARIPVGSNGTVLTADSTNANGVSWQAPFGSALVNGATANLVRTGPSGNAADPALTAALQTGHVYNFTINAAFYAPSAGVYIGVGYSGTFQTGSGVWGGYYNNYESGGGFTQEFPINVQTNVFLSGIDSVTLITITGTIYTTAAGNLYLQWGNPGAGSNTMTRYAGAGINVVQVV